MPEQRVKTVNFDVCKKALKLFGYHSNVFSNTSKIISVFTARRYASTVHAVVVCLPVCLSVTLQYCIKMAKQRITQIMPHDSPVFWFSDIKVHSEIRTG